MGHACAVNWTLLLEYLKVFLSWPVVVGIGAIVSIILFRKEVRKLIDRIANVEIAGFKLATQQAEALEVVNPEGLNVEAAEPAAPAVGAVEEAAPAELANLPIGDAERERLRAEFVAERAAAYMWEYRYLNFFFAPSTQAVLNWFFGIGGNTTLDAYMAYWTNRIFMQNEREAVLVALEKHNMLRADGALLVLTEKGREYHSWPDRRIMNIPNTTHINVPATTYIW